MTYILRGLGGNKSYVSWGLGGESVDHMVELSELAAVSDVPGTRAGAFRVPGSTVPLSDSLMPMTGGMRSVSVQVTGTDRVTGAQRLGRSVSGMVPSSDIASRDRAVSRVIPAPVMAAGTAYRLQRLARIPSVAVSAYDAARAMTGGMRHLSVNIPAMSAAMTVQSIYRMLPGTAHVTGMAFRVQRLARTLAHAVTMTDSAATTSVLLARLVQGTAIHGAASRVSSLARTLTDSGTVTATAGTAAYKVRHPAETVIVSALTGRLSVLKRLARDSVPVHGVPSRSQSLSRPLISAAGSVTDRMFRERAVVRVLSKAIHTADMLARSQRLSRGVGGDVPVTAPSYRRVGAFRMLPGPVTAISDAMTTHAAKVRRLAGYVTVHGVARRLARFGRVQGGVIRIADSASAYASWMILNATAAVTGVVLRTSRTGTLGARTGRAGTAGVGRSRPAVAGARTGGPPTYAKFSSIRRGKVRR